MGHGLYSRDAHETILRGRHGVPDQAVFARRSCHPLMNPKGVLVRESRDSEAHPRSLGIVFALDVTGSMGDIPRQLATESLPQFMSLLLDAGVSDPQILFLAVGDATSDSAPLQVGQFESSAELMDQWLTWSYLEAGGGAGGQESYELAMYFLAAHTEMDCFVKRHVRGYCFLTGDELPYPVLSRSIVEGIHGDRLDDDLKVEEIVAELQTTLVPFFIIPSPERRVRCEARWRELLGANVISLESPSDTCIVSAGIVALSEKRLADLDAFGAALRTRRVSQEQTSRAIRTLRSWTEANQPDAPRHPPAPHSEPGLLKRLLKGR